MTSPITPAIILSGYTTNLGVLFKREVTYSSSIDSCFIINDVPVNDIKRLSTLKNETWYQLPDAKNITSVKRKVPDTRKQVGWTLRKPEIASEAIPLTLSMTDLLWDDGDEEFVGKYAEFGSLYKEVFSVIVGQIEEVPFEFKNLGNIQITNFEKPEEMKVTLVNDNWNQSNKTQEVDLSKIVHFYQIEELLTPSFLLHTRPVYLTSKQVYSIVRAHIKSIYDPKKFDITSDYDFCFTVKKRVVVKPFTALVGKSVKKGRGWTTKHVKETISEKQVEVFAMTYAGYRNGNQGYEGYPVIDGWKANSVKELHDTIKAYLDDLSELLLADVEECECCKGFGHKVTPIDLTKRG